MSQFKKIVVGHDLWRGGDSALQSAKVFADHYGAAIKLVHVVEPHPFFHTLNPVLSHLPSLEELVRRAKAKLAERAADQGEWEVRTGKPFIELIAACRDWQADLLIVGGSVECQEPLLGSTSERLVRKAQVPVFVAKKPLRSEAKTVIVPTDFSPCATKAAEEALTFVRSFGGELFFVHALDIHAIYPDAYGLKAAWLPQLQPEAFPSTGEWEAFFAGLSSLENVTWHERTEEGKPAEAIVHLAADSKADLIVMGTHGRSDLKHMLLGSVAEQVVRTAACPVLTIRPDSFRFELP